MSAAHAATSSPASAALRPAPTTAASPVASSSKINSPASSPTRPALNPNRAHSILVAPGMVRRRTFDLYESDFSDADDDEDDDEEPTPGWEVPRASSPEVSPSGTSSAEAGPESEAIEGELSEAAPRRVRQPTRAMADDESDFEDCGQPALDFIRQNMSYLKKVPAFTDISDHFGHLHQADAAAWVRSSIHTPAGSDVESELERGPLALTRQKRRRGAETEEERYIRLNDVADVVAVVSPRKFGIGPSFWLCDR